MIDQCRLRSFALDFFPVPKGEATFPSIEFIHKRVAESIIDSNILEGREGMRGGQPTIRKVAVTVAAFEQIRAFYWGHRDSAAYDTPPQVPLKFYVTGLSSNPTDGEHVDVEIHPGVDDWEPK